MVGASKIDERKLKYAATKIVLVEYYAILMAVVSL